MMRAGLLAVTALLAYPVCGEAHAIDEYLQATRLAISHNRVLLELDLTPGLSVAAPVFELIDRNGDARITPVEIEAYAHAFLRELSVRVDDQECALTLAQAESPSWEEMQDGEGTIRLQAYAPVALKSGRHRIRYENMHRSTVSDVFLVNVLVPSTPDVWILAQHRDVLQRGIEVSIDVRASLNDAVWWLLPIGGFTALLVWRRRGDKLKVSVPIRIGSS
jgi:hypothetical protein